MDLEQTKKKKLGEFAHCLDIWFNEWIILLVIVLELYMVMFLESF